MNQKQDKDERKKFQSCNDERVRIERKVLEV